jgi:RNA polymerase sigma-70 factor (ECF subfamily)
VAVDSKAYLEELFLRILRRNESRLRMIARKHSSPNEFNDLYQEILLQIWRSLAKYRGRSHLDTWVYRVAMNTIRSYQRKILRRLRFISQSEFRQRYESPVPLHVYAPRSQSKILEEFANSLRQSDRMLFLMYLQDLTYRQLSEISGLDERHLRVKINRIKRLFLKRYIEGES